MHLILGGNRSGKSAYAESIAQQHPGSVKLIVTAEITDAHMRQRVAEHEQRRPKHWQVLEEHICLAQCLQKHAEASTLILVDCLTLWLFNLMHTQTDQILAQQKQEFLHLLPRLSGKVLLINNEINLGVVPGDSQNRKFCDQIGLLNQAVAAIADKVEWVVAGLPISLKS